MAEDTLYAFYDLQVSPVSYDISSFLVLAELARRERGLAHLSVVIVPGPSEGFRDDDAPYPTSNKSWRLQNILAPLCALLPAPVTLTLCRSRAEAAEVERSLAAAVFPADYRTGEPKAEFLWSGITAAAALGRDIPRFRASAEATASIARWLAAHAQGRRAIVITLRETGYAEVRNSNVPAWTAFARSLDTDRYFPVIVRDTERLFQGEDADFAGLTTCPPAALNVDLRLALYEQAWLNLMVPNGPNSICWLGSGIRSLTFKMVNDGWDSTTSLMLASLGIAPGGQSDFLAPAQRLVWEPDDLPVIEQEFAAMAARLDAAGDAERRHPQPETREDPFEIAVRLQLTGRFEDATAIYQEIVQRAPDNADAWHMLAIIAHQAERAETAETLVRRALTLKSDQANYHVTRGHVLRTLQRDADAETAFRRAVALSPEDAGAHADLAALLAARGKQGEAETTMMTALRLSPATVEYYEAAGRLLSDAGNAGEAVKFYRRAVELREEHASRARSARRHMPELPQVTLKT